MSKPLTRAQAVENRRFLHELARTGNVREAARRVGRDHTTFRSRRTRHPAFAQAWDAALATAQARLTQGAPKGVGAGLAAHRTAGGEPAVVRCANGRAQVRRARPGWLTKQAEQAFLLALGATANIALSAQAAGVNPAAFQKLRRRNPAFAREMREALAQGYERIETALVAAGLPESFADDAWRHNAPPELPPLSFDQMMQVLWHHKKTVLWGELPHSLRRRRGEPRDVYEMRLSALHDARMQAGRDQYAIARAQRRAAAGLEAGEAAIVLADWGVGRKG